MGFFHPPLLQALLKERVLLLGECPPFLLFFRGSPPLPLLRALREERAFLLRGAPPLLLPLSAHWGVALSGWGVPLSLLAARG